jgi:hypothetical protein
VDGSPGGTTKNQKLPKITRYYFANEIISAEEGEMNNLTKHFARKKEPQEAPEEEDTSMPGI